MNAKHSCKSNQWGTPTHIVECSRRIMGHIELDPASSSKFNEVVKAERYFSDSIESGLGWHIEDYDPTYALHWAAETVFCNPPSGNIRKSYSLPAGFMNRILHGIENKSIGEAFFVGYSIEQLQMFQKHIPNFGVRIINSVICIPKFRIEFDGINTSPTHANWLCYIPGFRQHYVEAEMEFRKLGIVLESYVPF